MYCNAIAREEHYSYCNTVLRAVARLRLCRLSNLGFYCKYNINYKSFKLLSLDNMRYTVFIVLVVFL